MDTISVWISRAPLGWCGSIGAQYCKKPDSKGTMEFFQDKLMTLVDRETVDQRS